MGSRSIKAEMFWFLREDIKDGKIQILDRGGLLAQLPTIRYAFTSKGQIVIEGKESMRKRGLKSPDWADCLALVNYQRRKFKEYSWKVDDYSSFGADRVFQPESNDSMSAMWDNEFHDSRFIDTELL